MKLCAGMVEGQCPKREWDVNLLSQSEESLLSNTEINMTSEIPSYWEMRGQDALCCHSVRATFML